MQDYMGILLYMRRKTYDITLHGTLDSTKRRSSKTDQKLEFKEESWELNHQSWRVKVRKRGDMNIQPAQKKTYDLIDMPGDED